MDTSTQTSVRLLDLARGVVAFVGLYQGVVPLVVRLLFGGDQRFAPALWLPAPWWWIACLAITVVMLALVTVLTDARRRRLGAEEAAPGDLETSRSEPDSDDTGGAFDAASGLVFLLGLYNGVAPFVVRLFGRDGLLLSLPTRLSAPWWWITSLLVLATSVVALAWIDHRKQQHLAGNRDT